MEDRDSQGMWVASVMDVYPSLNTLAGMASELLQMGKSLFSHSFFFPLHFRIILLLSHPYSIVSLDCLFSLFANHL